MISELEAKDLFGDMEPEQKTIHPVKTITLPKNDTVNHPAHYTTGKVECIDGIEAAIAGLDATEAFLTGCAIKYLWRWKKKGGVTDLQKSRWYLDRLIGQQNAG